MLKYIKWIFGANKPDYAQLVKDGAIIIDVRSANEYRSGHLKGSVNIPVDQINRVLTVLPDKDRPLITCCASGIRSASAKAILIANGYQHVYNAGRWHSLQDKI